MRRILLAAGLAVALPSAARAHPDSEPAQLGDRVRVTCPAVSPKPVIGTLVMTSEHELVVERADGPVSLRRDAVVALEKSVGRRPRRSIRIGGAVLGGLWVAAYRFTEVCAAVCIDDGAGGCRPCVSGWDRVVDYGTIALGATVGYGLGSLFKTETWEKAGGTALKLEAAPIRGGARVSLRLRF